MLLFFCISCKTNVRKLTQTTTYAVEVAPESMGCGVCSGPIPQTLSGGGCHWYVQTIGRIFGNDQGQIQLFPTSRCWGSICDGCLRDGIFSLVRYCGNEYTNGCSNFRIIGMGRPVCRSANLFSLRHSFSPGCSRNKYRNAPEKKGQHSGFQLYYVSFPFFRARRLLYLR